MEVVKNIKNCLSKIANFFKNCLSKIKNFFKNYLLKVKNFFKSGWHKITNLYKNSLLSAKNFFKNCLHKIKNCWNKFGLGLLLIGIIILIFTFVKDKATTIAIITAIISIIAILLAKNQNTYNDRANFIQNVALKGIEMLKDANSSLAQQVYSLTIKPLPRWWSSEFINYNAEVKQDSAEINIQGTDIYYGKKKLSQKLEKDKNGKDKTNWVKVYEECNLHAPSIELLKHFAVSMVKGRKNEEEEENEEERMKKKKNTELNLSGIWLHGADLKDANFQGANLERANFQGADLWDANFQRANLERANFQRANLMVANFKGADLIVANFQGAKLWSANFQGAYLLHANFQGADLIVANLQGADLEEANFQGADLKRANFKGADLIVANSEGAYRIVANFEVTDLEEANFQGADLKRANFKGADLEEANFQGAKNIKYENFTDARNIECAIFGRTKKEDEKIKREIVKASNLNINEEKLEDFFKTHEVFKFTINEEELEYFFKTHEGFK